MLRIPVLLAFLLLPFLSLAQTDSSYLRVSLLTVSVGDEIYASFGHTGIRITDTANHRDIVFNYGTFDGFDKDFEKKFVRGKLLYSISYDPFADFLNTYVREQRKVEEQELFLNGTQKAQLYDFLKENARPENKYYKYDFFYDNCATRIRDVFPKTFGEGFRFGQTIPKDSRMTFRQMINIYLSHLHWERFGINILLGSKIDKVMSNEDVMFLPDYLREGIGNATVNGKKIATAPVTLLDAAPLPPMTADLPFWVMLAVAFLTISGLTLPKFSWLGKVMSTLVLVVSGLLGCLVIVMWFGTDHQGCSNNFSLLWALPTNILVPFIGRNGKSRYAMIAIALLFLSLIVHITGIQQLPLTELWPLLLSLLFIYGMIYKHSKRIV